MTRLRERYNGATSANMRNMNGRIVAGQLGLAATQIFISVSQAVVLSICTGGLGAAAQAGNVAQATNAAHTAVTAAAGFAAISGMTSYQTSGNVGAAIATTGTQFTANLIGVGSGGQTVFMLALTSAGMNVANSTIIDYHMVGSQGSFGITESLARDQQARNSEAAWTSTPFYRAMAGLSDADLMSQPERDVRGMLLRPA